LTTRDEFTGPGKKIDDVQEEYLYRKKLYEKIFEYHILNEIEKVEEEKVEEEKVEEEKVGFQTKKQFYLEKLNIKKNITEDEIQNLKILIYNLFKYILQTYSFAKSNFDKTNITDNKLQFPKNATIKLRILTDIYPDLLIHTTTEGDFLDNLIRLDTLAGTRTYIKNEIVEKKFLIPFVRTYKNTSNIPRGTYVSYNLGNICNGENQINDIEKDLIVFQSLEDAFQIWKTRIEKSNLLEVKELLFKNFLESLENLKNKMKESFLIY
jgi:hypothetical protein